VAAGDPAVLLPAHLAAVLLAYRAPHRAVVAVLAAVLAADSPRTRTRTRTRTRIRIRIRTRTRTRTIRIRGGPPCAGVDTVHRDSGETAGTLLTTQLRIRVPSTKAGANAYRLLRATCFPTRFVYKEWCAAASSLLVIAPPSEAECNA
jgi:hypothetical protein